MHTFLGEKTRFIFENHTNDWDNISIIIPNKRATVYIQKYFAELAKTPIFSPQILTINEWIDQNTPYKIITQTELLFVLYDVHCEIEKKSADDFNTFIKWGKIILSDFDEIDRYLIPPKLVFRDLRNIKEIENWSFLEEELSEGQEAYKTLWDKLPKYYAALQKLLEEKKYVYQGAAYKLFYEQLSTNKLVGLNNYYYYFIGFNALSESEDQIIRHLMKEKKATVFFDTDKSYFDNTEHEAGHFYRKILRKWQIKKELGTHFNEQPKQITVIETAQQIGQAKIAGSIIADLVKSGQNLDATAIVLADESLLIPLTRSLPNTIDQANITMGYPLKFSHLKSLIDIVFDLQFNFQKFKSKRIYHKSLLSYLDHPYLAVLIDNHETIIAFEEDVINKNKIFIDVEELFDFFPELKKIESLFSVWKNPMKYGFLGFNQLTKALYEALKNAEKEKEKY